MSVLRDMIEIKKGCIQDAPKAWDADAIVNAANPTLMGRDLEKDGPSVDAYIHGAEARLQRRPDALKIMVKEAVDGKDDGEEQIIRCRRGEVVVTSKHFLCGYILHTVGPENDQDDSWPKVCSSSRIRMLESCYRNIILETVKRPEIKTLAVPVISAGSYHMPYSLAVKVGITTIYNTLLEMKQQDREFFEYMGLRKIYFVIPEAENFEIADGILDRYRQIFYREHRVVAQDSLDCQLGFYREIKLYDERRGYFSVAQKLRLFLVIIRMIFSFPYTYAKDWIGKENWVIRRKVVECTTIWKAMFPIAAYFIIRISNGGEDFLCIWSFCALSSSGYSDVPALLNYSGRYTEAFSKYYQVFNFIMCKLY